MISMARAGGGNHYYGDTAADLFEPFAEEFDLISNLYARQVRLSIATCPGVGMKVLNDYPMDARAGVPAISLPDIPWGAEAWVLVELSIPAGFEPLPGMPLLQAGVTGTCYWRCSQLGCTAMFRRPPAAGRGSSAAATAVRSGGGGAPAASIAGSAGCLHGTER